MSFWKRPCIVKYLCVVIRREYPTIVLEVLLGPFGKGVCFVFSDIDTEIANHLTAYLQIHRQALGHRGTGSREYSFQVGWNTVDPRVRSVVQFRKRREMAEILPSIPKRLQPFEIVPTTGEKRPILAVDFRDKPAIRFRKYLQYFGHNGVEKRVLTHQVAF